MNIKIQNLGTIKEACIDLNKKLTVFCGPNNTGKTYVSYIIYALTNISMKPTQVLSDDMLKNFIQEGQFSFEIDTVDVFRFRNELTDLIKDNLSTIFGVSDEKTQSYFSTFNLSFESTPEEFHEKIIKEGFKLNVSVLDVDIQITKMNDSRLVLIENVSEKKAIKPATVQFLTYQMLTMIYSCLALYPASTSAIFPVERNSIYTFSKELSLQRNLLIEQMQELSSNKKLNPWDLLEKRSTRYPLAVRDCLEVADDLVNLQSRRSPFYEFAEQLEEQLLKGKISVSKDGEVIYVPTKAKSVKLPIHLSASIVKTLSSLTFYLRYLAKSNDLIIIDEPELNLHPDNQIVLTRLFAKLINKGFRLLISTNSDYIIRELNNLVMLSSASEDIKELATKYGYEGDEMIPSNEVKAYLFKHKGRKVVVKDIEVSEYGFEVETIDEAIRNLNNISEDLYCTMRYGK